MAGVRRIPFRMTRLVALAEKAVNGRSIAQAARDGEMPYQQLWDLLHEKSTNPQLETIEGLQRVAASAGIEMPYGEIMEAIRDDRVARRSTTRQPIPA